MQEISYGSNEGSYASSHQLVNQSKYGGNICPVKTRMHASNIQSKQAHRQPLHGEPYEAKGAIEGGVQEAPAL